MGLYWNRFWLLESIPKSDIYDSDSSKKRNHNTSSTGPIGYSDSAGRSKKCHFKQLALYPMIFIVRRSFLGPKNCHRSRIVTPTGVTVTNRACSDISLAFAHLVPRQEK